MTKQEIISKVNELIAAPTCNANLKAAAEEYVKNQDKKSAEALVKSLEENVNSIDEVIGLCESDMGKNIFGAEQAANMAKLGHEKKSQGEKFCFCPACQVGHVIYENKEAL